MKTLILPGYSLSNREWAQKVKEGVENSFVHEWKHWESGEQRDFSVPYEIEKIKSEVEKSKINIIAKSIGTLVAAGLLKEIGNNVSKIILLGIPRAFIKDNDLGEKSYFAFSQREPESVMVIQNSKDPLASYNEVKDMFSQINNKINVIEKESDTHDYPYFDEFSTFLGQ